MTSGGAATVSRTVARLMWRRDRWVLLPWLVILGLLPAGYASATGSLYPTLLERQAFLRTLADDRLLIFLYGRVPDPTVGSLVAWRYGVAPLLAGLLFAFLAIRHTRAEEDSGRLELLRGTPITSTAAPLLVVGWLALSSVLLALLICLGLVSQGVPVTGSVALGLTTACTAMLFGAVGLLLSQVLGSAGMCRAVVVVVLVVSLATRGVADINASGSGGSNNLAAHLDWLSPLGWAQAVRPFGEARWWLLSLPVVATALLVAATCRLAMSRDLGSGLVAPRAGRARAPGWLRSPRALCLRIQLPALGAWSAAFFATGMLLGATSNVGGDAVGGNAAFGRLAGGTASSQAVFMTAAFALSGLAAAAFAVQACLRARQEEQSGRAELLLSAAVRPTAWLTDHVLVGVVGAAWLLLLCGVGAALTDSGHQGAAATVVLAAVAQAPATWVLAGVTTLLIGVLPRASTAGWAVLATILLVGTAGAVLDAPSWLQDLSPLRHTARPLLTHDLSWIGSGVWTAAATVAGMAGILAFGRRDIAPE